MHRQSMHLCLLFASIRLQAREPLRLSRAEYLDRVQAVWTNRMKDLIR